MATSRTIKNRIRATKNIGQITKAMQAVSAVKMRKSEQGAIKARPYALAALEILKNVRRAITEEDVSSDLIKERPVKKICLVVVTSDKGLAGSFNSNVLRKSQQILNHSPAPVEIVAIGRRGRDFFSRRGQNIIKEFYEAGDYITLSETLPIAKYLLERYQEGQFDEVILVYTNFLSALKQTVVVRKILPVTVKALEEITAHIIPEHGLYAGMPQAIDRALDNPEEKISYLYEPSAPNVLEDLLPRLVSIELHQSILEANASEHSSRMIAMKNASENALELIDELGITYNKLRQGAITKELTEISAGTEALAQR